MGKEKVEKSAEITGGLCAAALSSICCWGPLLLALFGVGSAGITGFFVRYRWLLIIIAVSLLSRALYLAYQCQNKRNIVITWLMIVIALGFMSFPYLRVFIGI